MGLSPSEAGARVLEDTQLTQADRGEKMLGFPLLLTSDLPQPHTSKPRGDPSGTPVGVTVANNSLWSISFSLSTGTGLADF